MNFNAIIATLVVKGVITREEGQAIVDFLHDKPQSTQLNDTIKQIKEFMTMDNTPLTGGPEQQAEELRARELAAQQRAQEAAAAEAEEAVASEETTSNDKASKK